MLRRAIKTSPTVLAMMVVIIMSAGIIYAASQSYRVTGGGGSLTVNEFGICKKVANNNSNDIFVPTNSLGEWSAFISNAPNVVLSACWPAVSFVSMGYDWGCGIIASTGAVMCWGAGYGSSPVALPGLTSGVTSLSAGVSHSCAVVNGAAKCWSRDVYSNGYGQLGDGTTVAKTVPTAVSGLTSGVTAISVGGYGSCAVVNGAAKCWGRNNLGQIGDNTKVDKSVPTAVSGLTSGVTAISVGTANACAIVNGAAKCWGDNSSGELGDGTTVSKIVPTAVSGLTSGVTAIAAGENGLTTCAIVNGAAKCWGDNSSGTIGDGTLTNRLVPTAVSGLASGVTSISSGGQHTCAIVNNIPKCWGQVQQAGQPGNNVFTNKTPIDIPGISTASSTTAISAGTFFNSCAVVNAGAYCWGANSSGELGNGTTTQPSTAVGVSGLSP